jgi:phosphoserine phosphatase
MTPSSSASFSHVLVLTGEPSALTPKLAETARQSLRNAGTVSWLCEGVACEIPCSKNDAGPARKALQSAKVDVNVVPSEGRRKALLIADMDSTMITVECIDEIADLAGIKPQVAAITERAMRGEIDFEDALLERVSLLKGLEADRLNTVYENQVRFTPGAAALVNTMRANGAFTALVSGGFSHFADKVSAALGFHWAQSNDLAVGKDGLLTGELLPPLLGTQAKAHALQAICSQQEIPLSRALAVGDGANDLEMIQLAGLGAAFHAKPKVVAAADVSITHSDLTALLYLQGYKRDEFVSGWN